MPVWEDKVELVSEIERVYEIQFVSNEGLLLATVRDLLDIVMAKLEQKPNHSKPDESVVWSGLRELIAKELGVRVRDIELDVRFYEDLNCGGAVRDGVPYTPWWDQTAVIIILACLLALVAFILAVILQG